MVAVSLPPAALAAVRQVAEELTVRESMIFLDGREFTGEPPGLRTVQRGQLMLGGFQPSSQHWPLMAGIVPVLTNDGTRQIDEGGSGVS
jgi:hypothetical protein